MGQNDPEWSKTCCIDHREHFVPFRPLKDIGKPAMFGHFWSQKGLFGPPCAQDWRMAMAETTSNQLPICLRIRHVRRIPKGSIFMAVITTKVTKRLKKIWAKSAL